MKKRLAVLIILSIILNQIILVHAQQNLSVSIDDDCGIVTMDGIVKICYGTKYYYIDDRKIICEEDGRINEILVTEGEIQKLALDENIVYAVIEKTNNEIEWITIDESLSGTISLMNVTGTSNEEQIFYFIKNQLGLNTAIACGILANIYCESGFRPGANCIDTNGLTSYGICQWNGGRFDSLKRYCSNIGYDYRTIEGQLLYLQYELQTDEKRAWNKIIGKEDSSSGAYDAGYSWAQNFERCASRYYTQRAVLARDTYYPSWSGAPSGGGTIINSGNDPEGCIDIADGGIESVHIAGWAFDYDDGNAPLGIHVYIGGPAGEGEGHAMPAQGYSRPDVAGIYGIGENHGFDYTIQTDKRGEQSVYIYAINIGAGTNALIGEERVTIYEDSAMHNPEGCIDSASGGFGTFSIGGWAFDYDDGNTPLEIHVYVGGPAGEGTGYNLGSASLYRPDVANAYGVGENHGFDFTHNTDKYGEQALYIYAINVGKGINALIGTEKVTIKEQYKTCVDKFDFKDNTLTARGWAIAGENNGNVKVKLQIDSMPEIELSRYDRSDVHNAYPDYASENEGFHVEVDGVNLSNGNHVAILNAYYGGKTIQLGRLEFTSQNDHKPKKTIVRNNHIYSIFDVEMDWMSAEKLSENKGGHLITISSTEEDLIINELLEYGSIAQYWIGADNENDSSSNWNWVTGESFNYTNWATGEPNNAGGKEYYAGVYSNGTWNDFPYNQSNIGYIMETEISGEPVASIENDGHYYYLYDNETDWHGAKAFCEAMGGHLVTITDKKEQALVQSLASQGSSDFTSYFIGATDNEDGSTWKWITGEKFDYTNWEDGEPNNTNDIKHYAEIYKTGMWNDRESFNNGAKNGFICEIEEDDTYTAKAEYNGNTYLRIDKSLSWEDAKAYCESRGGHLATITDEDEQEAIEDLLCRGVDTLRSVYAIGGTDADSEGTWKWITGEDFDYENWDNGEPNNGGENSKGSQNYLTIYSKSDAFGLWDDNWNFNQNPYDIGFICEIENTETTPEPSNPVQPDIDESLSTVTVGTVSSKSGETITIPISISNNQGICESKFVLNYDNTKLTPISIELADGFADGCLQTDINNISEDKNTLTMTWENNSIADNSNNGDMFTITFNVAEETTPGMIPISIDSNNLDIINAAGEDVNINLIDGGVMVEETQFTYGDVNCDEKINIIDIVLMRKYYANLSVDIPEEGLLAADVNVDGKIDNKDILLMRKYVAKWNGIVLGR